MKMVQAIIRNEKFLDVKEALKAMGIKTRHDSIFRIRLEQGQGTKSAVEGEPIAHDLIGKSKLETIVPDSHVQNVISAITERGRTWGARRRDCFCDADRTDCKYHVPGKRGRKRSKIDPVFERQQSVPEKVGKKIEMTAAGDPAWIGWNAV